jgi:hypothetical protein
MEYWKNGKGRRQETEAKTGIVESWKDGGEGEKKKLISY